MTTVANSNAPMTINEARAGLLKVWLWAIVPLTFVFAQTLFGKYGTTWPDLLDGLAFVLGLIGPQFGIMLGATQAIQTNNARARAHCHPVLYMYCRWMSIVLIVAVTSVLLAEPLVALKVKELLAVSNAFLQLLSWVLGGVLIAFFVA